MGIAVKEGLINVENRVLDYFKEEEQMSRKWKYSAHHQWVNDGTLMVSVVYRKTGYVQKWLFTFTDRKMNLVISNSCKKLFGLSFDMVSDRNVDFADMRFSGSR